MTDELQPLDGYVFGVMKANCRHSCRRFIQANPEAIMNQQIAAAFLIRAWESVSTQTLDEAWCIYDEEVENQQQRHPLTPNQNEPNAFLKDFKSTCN
jgi:hypothetical protein